MDDLSFVSVGGHRGILVILGLSLPALNMYIYMCGVGHSRTSVVLYLVFVLYQSFVSVIT